MSAIELLEQAVALLRLATPRALLAYLAGAVPFGLALLFFLNEMWRSPFAFERLALWSLALAALYIWKNTWQAVFAAELYRGLSPGSRAPVNVWKLVAIQAALQPVGLALLLPFPWIVAFFRNAALFAALGKPHPLRTARKQAMLWTRQNWGVIGIATLGGILLFLNIGIMILALPQLARSFLGIEGDLVRLGWRILNASSIAAAAVLAWMIVDPLLDAAYVLRCYYGESIATGEDLMSALRRAIAAIVLAGVFFSAAPQASAQVEPAQLDRSIDNVIHSHEFTWRAPRPEAPEPQGKWVGWVRSVQKAVADVWNWVVKAIRNLLERNPKPEVGGEQAGVSRRTMELLIGLAIALVLAAAIAFYLRRRAPAIVAQPVTLAAAVNLADESVTADQLPESSWLRLAEELLGKGDARLALRALYLAGLNYLGGRGLISIRKWKSGLDYRRELERRTRAAPEVGVQFARINGIFEYGWYGVHTVDRGMVESFAAGLQALKNQAEAGF